MDKNKKKGNTSIENKKKGEKKMEDIIKTLNELLADLAVFYRKIQNYHWNVKGKDFFTVHAKLEEYYDEINENIDTVAEHILTLGGEPLGTMKDYLAVTSIKEAKNEKVDIETVLVNVANDFSMLLLKLKEIKSKADILNDYVTSAMMDSLMESYDKKVWMIKQTLEK